MLPLLLTFALADGLIFISKCSFIFNVVLAMMISNYTIICDISDIKYDRATELHEIIKILVILRIIFHCVV